jgi:hypothetical protein
LNLFAIRALMILTGIVISGAGAYYKNWVVMCFGAGIMIGVAARMLDDSYDRS